MCSVVNKLAHYPVWALSRSSCAIVGFLAWCAEDFGGEGLRGRAIALGSLPNLVTKRTSSTRCARCARFGNWFTVERALPISHSQRVEMAER